VRGRLAHTGSAEHPQAVERPADPLPRETETQFQGWVIDRAHLSGWYVVHFRAAYTHRGYRTPVQADGAGWPDLELVRERIVYAELKSAGRKLDPDQELWRRRLVAAGAEWHLWRPGDRDAITEVLR
jgi:hypothetical protein